MRLHPCLGLAFVAVGPLHAIPMKDEQPLIGKAIGIDRREVRRIRHVKPGRFENWPESAMGDLRIVITVACQE